MCVLAFAAANLSLVCDDVAQFNDNPLSSWRDVDQLASCPKLTCVYFERCPIAAETSYRRKLKLALPGLVQIDSRPCLA